MEQGTGTTHASSAQEPMSAELAAELTAWQEHGAATWDTFTFDVSDPVLGLFADIPEVVDAITEDAMATRETHPLRVDDEGKTDTCACG